MKIVKDFLSDLELLELYLYSCNAHYEPGRQGTGYEKSAVPQIVTHTTKSVATVRMAVFQKRALGLLGLSLMDGFDCYFVRYPEGSHIPLHLDDAPLAQEHHRVNVLLHAPEAGGEHFVDGRPVSLSAGDAYVFRPDLEQHEVKSVLRGERLIWTLGALR